jgi:hypothetical protein
MLFLTFALANAALAVSSTVNNAAGATGGLTIGVSGFGWLVQGNTTSGVSLDQLRTSPLQTCTLAR